MTESKLINALQDVLDKTIKTKLKTQGLSACKKELAYVRGAFKQFSTALAAHKDQRFFSKQDKEFSIADLMYTLQSVAKRIEAEEKSLEIEMHGVQHFSGDARKRIDTFAHKKILKDALEKMVKKIRSEWPEIKEAKPVKWYYSLPR